MEAGIVDVGLNKGGGANVGECKHLAGCLDMGGGTSGGTFKHLAVCLDIWRRG